MRNNAELLWRRILIADPEAVFGTQASRLMNRNWADRLPQPGYMGLRYGSGGLETGDSIRKSQASRRVRVER